MSQANLSPFTIPAGKATVPAASTPLFILNGVSIAAIPTSQGLWRICEADPEAEIWRLSETSWYTFQAAERGYAIHLEADTIDFGPWMPFAVEIAEAA